MKLLAERLVVGPARRRPNLRTRHLVGYESRVVAWVGADRGRPCLRQHWGRLKHRRWGDAVHLESAINTRNETNMKVYIPII